MKKNILVLITGLFLLSGTSLAQQKLGMATNVNLNTDSAMRAKVNEYAVVKLTTNAEKISEKEKKVILLLIEAAQIMDRLYWLQTYGEPETLYSSISNEIVKKYVAINYGPWDRLDNNKPFTGTLLMPAVTSKDKETQPVEKMAPKPLGANFYPLDMTKEEFDNLKDENKTNPYTLIRRGDDGGLKVVWYHQEYYDLLSSAADIMLKAAETTDNQAFSKYLNLRAMALRSSNYQPSDFAWMDMKDNHIDFVVGPIENYEDGLYEYKTAFEAFVLVKDLEWSQKLEKFIALLPDLQKNLPVNEAYKKEVPGTSSDLGVYDALYYAGDCNAGSKTIAINLPNDEQVQLKSGSRRLQLKNTMQAKFDKILYPIAQKMIDPTQLKNVKFDAFFNNVMFHEVAHGLGIKNTVNGKGNVRDAMKETYSSFEEAKADILGLYMATQLIEQKQITGITITDCYVTFIAGIFRSVRFGASSAHGKANMMCFNSLLKAEAFKRNEKGYYTVNMTNMKKAINEWINKIITFQATGDYDGAKLYLKDNATISQQLQKDLDLIKTANIPKDVVFEQGTEVLGF
jgi:hypothetical protein